MLRKILNRFSLISAKKSQQLALHVGSTALRLVDVDKGKIAHATVVNYTSGNMQTELAALFSTITAGSRLHIVLAPEFYQLVQLDKPTVPDAEVLQALPWQIKDLVSIAADDMVVDYIDLPSVSAAADKINVVAASFSWLKQLVQQAEHAGIALVSIEPEEWLAARLIPPTPQATMLVVHQPEQEVLIQIVRDGALYFSRRTRGFSNLHQSTMAELQDGTLDRLQLELQRSMDYFESQLKQPPVRDIRLLMTKPAMMCELFMQSGFSRVEPLVKPESAVVLTAEQLLDSWPAVAALVPLKTELMR